jgi:hypothetical protein
LRRFLNDSFIIAPMLKHNRGALMAAILSVAAGLAKKRDEQGYAASEYTLTLTWTRLNGKR